MTLAEIVDQLRRCDYEAEHGRLVDNEAFQELEKIVPFTHRNGETEPPTQDGAYWFLGDVEEVANFEVPFLVEVVERSALIAGYEGTYYLGWFKGQWSGPLLDLSGD